MQPNSQSASAYIVTGTATSDEELIRQLTHKEKLSLLALLEDLGCRRVRDLDLLV